MAADKTQFDLIVIGTGAAGMTAALVGAIKGLDVLLLERASTVGGTTAISAGSAWVPTSLHDRTGADSAENALRYLQETVDGHAPDALRRAFLDKGPQMIRLLEQETDVHFRPYAHLPDYYSELASATVTGRVLETVPFDGRRLGGHFALLRPPLPEFTIFGGMMVSRTDIAHLLGASQSLSSFTATVRMLARHAADRLRYPRGTRLVMGNALVARLLFSLLRRGVTPRVDCRTMSLIVDAGRVTGVRAEHNGPLLVLNAKRGVVLAAGGFSHHPRLRSQLLPRPTAQYSVIPADNDGGGIELGLQAGGRLGEGYASATFWAPSSVRKRPNGTTAVFPHFALDRGKPGMIAVNAAGRRFVNEATSYQRFGEAMYREHARSPAIPCFLICDAAALRKYGLGMIHPRVRNVRRHIEDGYLTSADTLAGLARTLSIEPEALRETVERYNAFARQGHDPDFGKGTSAYSRNLGDASITPNPCVGPLETSPFYAVRIYPADIAATCGLVTNADAQVLDAAGHAIDGLYAAGNDMHSVTGGVYAGPGITIGAAMTFGYAAAMHAAR